MDFISFLNIYIKTIKLMKKKKFRLKKPITELVDDTLSLISGDNKDHVNQNVRSPKTIDSKIAATTQPFSWNRKIGFGGEYYPDAYFSVSESDDKLKENNISEQKALKMIEDIMSKRSELRDIEEPISIPTFDELQKIYPIISRHITLLADKIKDKKDEDIGKYGATILSEIMDSFDVDQISPKLKKVLISKLKGITYNGL